LPDFDYTQPGAYFITICTHDRIHLFGEIRDGKMVLNESGRIAYDEWMQTPKIRPDTTLDEFVVMPNHIHGIIRRGDPAGRPCRGNPPGRPCAKTTNGPASGSIGAIIGQYKSLTTKRIRAARLGTPMATVRGIATMIWQRGYYDHIIRDDESLNRIREYISNNPLKWHEDRENVRRKPSCLVAEEAEPWEI